MSPVSPKNEEPETDKSASPIEKDKEREEKDHARATTTKPAAKRRTKTGCLSKI